jgi:uncharacterized protein
MASDRLRGNSNVTPVFLDTNAVFTIFEFSLDVESELSGLLGSFTIYIPLAVVHEIEIILEKGKGKQRILAKPALQFIKRYSVWDHPKYDTADDALLYEAEKNNAVVVTNDSELRDRLKERKIPRVFLRGKQRLVLEP